MLFRDQFNALDSDSSVLPLHSAEHFTDTTLCQSRL